MHTRRAALISCVVFALTVSSAWAQRVFTVTGQEVPALAEFDEIMRDLMEQYDQDGAALALTLDGRLIFARGYTWAEPGAEIITPTHLFRMASKKVPGTPLCLCRRFQTEAYSVRTASWRRLLGRHQAKNVSPSR